MAMACSISRPMNRTVAAMIAVLLVIVIETPSSMSHTVSVTSSMIVNRTISPICFHLEDP